MAENSGIEWTHHTSLDWSKQRQIILMHKPMTVLAKGDAVAGVCAPCGVVSKSFEVVDLQVAAPVIAAMTACKVIAHHAVVSPLLVSRASPLTSTLHASPVDEARSIFASWRPLTRYLTDLCLGFWRVRFADPIAWTGLGRRTHLRTAFVGHDLALHRRDKGPTPLLPSLLHNLTAGYFCHG